VGLATARTVGVGWDAWVAVEAAVGVIVEVGVRVAASGVNANGNAEVWDAPWAIGAVASGATTAGWQPANNKTVIINKLNQHCFLVCIGYLHDQFHMIIPNCNGFHKG